MAPNKDAASEGDYFAAVAGSYDRMQPILAGPAYERGLRMALELAPFGRHDEFAFLDLGVGTGALALSLLDRFPRSRGIGIDAEQNMLNVARPKLSGYGDRIELRAADFTECRLPRCDLAVSAYAFHHVSPEAMPGLLGRIAAALSPLGCFILADQMSLGPPWGERIVEQVRRLQREHTAAAIRQGRTTQEEVDARWALKREMKAAGKDVEYRHDARQLCGAVLEAGFAEAGIAWHMLTHAVLLAFAGR
jgi:cyclopropane fatty-acyl-phospholipid synthase-like methyltransferase